MPGSVEPHSLAAGAPRRGAGLRLTVIVPATNAPPTLERTLAAIHRGICPTDEVLVVHEPAHIGPAAARNRGVARARGDVMVFVDADVELAPDTLARIRAAFETDPGLGAVFGSYDDRPAAPGIVSAFRNLLHHHVHHASAGPAQTFWAGLGAVRRDAFLAVNGFDAARFAGPSMEDIDLGMRLAKTGARIVLDPAIQGTHLKSWTLRGMLRTDFWDRGVPWVRLLCARRTVPTSLNLGWRHRLSALATIGAPTAMVVGHLLLATLAVALLIVLNRSFYGLLLRRRGPFGAAAGVALHAVHHLTAAAALVVGVVIFAVAGARTANAPAARPAPATD